MNRGSFLRGCGRSTCVLTSYYIHTSTWSINKHVFHMQQNSMLHLSLKTSEYDDLVCYAIFSWSPCLTIHGPRGWGWTVGSAWHPLPWKITNNLMTAMQSFPWRTIFAGVYMKGWGAQWLSGRVLDSRPKGRRFEPYRCHWVVVLEQDTFILA